MPVAGGCGGLSPGAVRGRELLSPPAPAALPSGRPRRGLTPAARPGRRLFLFFFFSEAAQLLSSLGQGSGLSVATEGGRGALSSPSRPVPPSSPARAAQPRAPSERGLCPPRHSRCSPPRTLPFPGPARLPAEHRGAPGPSGLGRERRGWGYRGAFPPRRASPAPSSERLPSPPGPAAEPRLGRGRKAATGPGPRGAGGGWSRSVGSNPVRTVGWDRGRGPAGRAGPGGAGQSRSVGP